MRTLRKFNALAFVAVLILVSGCATNRTSKTAATNTDQTTSAEGFIGPESCVKPTNTTGTRWWEYAFMPVTVGCGLLRWYSDLPGIANK